MTVRHVSGKPHGGTIVEATDRDLTFYVRTGGSDTADGLTVGNALLTIQEAVDRVPKLIEHDVVIDVGEGTFAGFTIESLHVRYSGSLTVQGVQGAYSPATGNDSGTATGGSTTQLIDTGSGTWTTNDLRGAFLLVDGEYRSIRNNDGTTINIVGTASASYSGKSYQIVEPTTLLNSAGSRSTGSIEVMHCEGARRSITIQDMKTTVGLMGAWSGYTNSPRLYRIVSEDQSYGFVWQDVWGSMDATELIAENSTNEGYTITRFGGGSFPTQFLRLFAFECGDAGFAFWSNWGEIVIGWLTSDDNDVGIDCIYNRHLNFDTIEAYSNTSDGLKLRDIFLLDLDTCTIDNNGGYGVYIDENTSGNRGANTFFNAAGNLTISNNTSGGIVAKNHTIVAITNCDGTGNGGYGLELQTGSSATITTDTDITGSSGDAMINDGTTVLDWTDDFGSDGDKVINIVNQCLIERKDS